VVESDARNISTVRNAGAAVATGDVVVTIDADCVMSPAAFVDIGRLIDCGRYVGGGTLVRPERMSAGIRATIVLVSVMTFLTRLSGGMFWCRRADFDAIGGFDESLLLAEDLDFARRLRAHGRHTGRRFTMLRTAPITSSCRKFDRFGDWHMFGMALQAREIRAVMKGTDTAWVDRYFFDFND
jgi:glycosyltransferase involved in cell wall biosynthesis